jgi:hypothetical protein
MKNSVEDCGRLHNWRFFVLDSYCYEIWLFAWQSCSIIRYIYSSQNVCLLLCCMHSRSTGNHQDGPSFFRTKVSDSSLGEMKPPAWANTWTLAWDLPVPSQQGRHPTTTDMNWRLLSLFWILCAHYFWNAHYLHYSVPLILFVFLFERLEPLVFYLLSPLQKTGALVWTVKNWGRFLSKSGMRSPRDFHV